MIPQVTLSDWLNHLEDRLETWTRQMDILIVLAGLILVGVWSGLF